MKKRGLAGYRVLPSRRLRSSNTHHSTTIVSVAISSWFPTKSGAEFPHILLLEVMLSLLALLWAYCYIDETSSNLIGSHWTTSGCLDTSVFNFLVRSTNIERSIHKICHHHRPARLM